jgi:hypothetical protein
MAGPIYISNPALWEQLRHTEDGKDFIPSIRRHTQRGGGILNRRKAYMIPVTNKAPIQQVTPVAAEQQRALSDLKETIRNDEPHMPLKPIKRKKTAKSVSRSKTVKGKGRFKTTKGKGRLKTTKGKGRVKRSKKVRRPAKPTKKKSKIPSRLLGKTIF